MLSALLVLLSPSVLPPSVVSSGPFPGPAARAAPSDVPRDAPELAALVAALQDEREPVRVAAIAALGRAGDGTAFAALRDHHARVRELLPERPAEHVELLRALARHARPAAIDLLTADAASPMDAELVRARVFGLANVGGRDALAGVFYVLSQLSHEEAERSRADLRLALVRSSGVDHGLDFGRWRAFWSASARTFEPPPRPPALAPRDLKAWRRFWGEP